MSDSLKKLALSGKTVFDTSDLAILWGISNKDYLKTKIYYWTKNSRIKRLAGGIYSFYDNYNNYELAAKILAPSYISLETVLRENGCLFQYDTKITSVSNLRRNFEFNGLRFEYNKIKDNVLFNPEGINMLKCHAIATPERAFLDLIYLNKEYYFDRLSNLNWDRCFDLVKIYQNKSLILRLNKYKEIYA
jgi:hypothetical protein